MEQKNVLELHTEHITWLNKLSFYKDDLGILEKRLEEIASKNNGKEVTAMIEQFQNKFILQRETIDILRHDISEHERFINKKIGNDHNGAEKMNDHPLHRERVRSFEKGMQELRREFIDFAARWM